LTTWTAVVPIKAAAERKTRLAGDLSLVDRERLTERLLRGVIGALDASRRIARIIVLSGTPPGMAGVDWVRDEGRGLNTELAKVTVAGPLLIIHADLPLIDAGDIVALLDAAAHGGAIAPDRHGLGTNALAFGDGRRPELRFGPGSLARHRAQPPGGLKLVERPGLALDIDTADDLAEARRLGFSMD
jgi:2-phospho-L-lactate guanylyltransferase